MAAAALAVVALGAPLPAAADPARPTNYRSEVTAVDPASAGISVEVTGGDAFLRLIVEQGVTVGVPGYEGEPYLRILADGTVEVNLNSPTHWVNEDRFGASPVPPTASADADPVWKTIRTDGTYGWHDHRIHWMSPEPPPAVDRTTRSEILEWVVPLLVDERPVQVRGALEWLPATNPLPWVAFGVAAVVIAWVSHLPVLLAGVVSAVGVGFAQVIASPLGFGGEFLAWVPPLAAALMLGAAVFSGRRLYVGVAAVLLLAWVVPRLAALWMPSLPTALPDWLERGATALAAGAGLGGVVAAYRETRRPIPD